MRYTGNVLIPSPPTDVWSALIDPEQMSQCMPGLTTWRTVQPQKVFQLHLAWATETSQPIQVPVRIEWLQQTAVRYLQLTATTTLGGTHQIVATGDVTLTPTDNGTDLAFSADVTTPNPVMDRLVHTAVPKLTANFFHCLKTKLSAPS